MQLIEEIIESYNGYLQTISGAGKKIATLLRTEQTDDAMMAINHLAEGLMWLSEVALKLRENDFEVVLDTEEVVSYLTEINEGLQIQDYVLVADLFEYEVDPFIESMQPIKFRS